jgi:hypothetical protein
MRVQREKLDFFFWKTTKKTKILKITKKIKILIIPPHFKHNIVLNVEIKEKEYKRMTKIK